MASHQINGVSHNGSPLYLHLGAQSPKALDVLVNGTASDIAAARQGNLGALVLSEERPDKIVGSADLSYVLIVHADFLNVSGINPRRVAVNAVHPRPDLLDGLQEYIDIPHIRQVFYDHFFVGHY